MTIPESDLTDCPCSRAHRINREHHDWILSFEERGLTGAMEVWAYMDTEAGSIRVDGTIRWQEMDEFVAMHNWQSPADVFDFVGWVTAAIRLREERFKEREVVRLAS